MTLFVPFVGTLYLPDKEFLASTTPIQLPGGRTVARITWRTWTQRFDVADPSGRIVARCHPEGALRRRFQVRMGDGRRVIDFVAGARGARSTMLA